MVCKVYLNKTIKNAYSKSVLAKEIHNISV